MYKREEIISCSRANHLLNPRQSLAQAETAIGSGIVIPYDIDKTLLSPKMFADDTNWITGIDITPTCRGVITCIV